MFCFEFEKIAQEIFLNSCKHQNNERNSSFNGDVKVVRLLTNNCQHLVTFVLFCVCRRTAGQLQPRGAQFCGGSERRTGEWAQQWLQSVPTEHPVQCEDRETAREAAQAGKTHGRRHAHSRSQGLARAASAAYGTYGCQICGHTLTISW